MNIFIDCEWNDFRGELISMALVPESGEEFYEVLEYSNLTPWVIKNVIPVLGKAPIGRPLFQVKLAEYLKGFNPVNIIADWPEDVERVCSALITSPGTRLGPDKLSFEVDCSLDSEDSKTPHNALCDARAIRDRFVAK